MFQTDDGEAVTHGARRAGKILIVEDDPEVRDLLSLLLSDEGHRAIATSDGRAALDLVAQGAMIPEILLTDYNLPNGMDGLEVAAKIREALRPDLPTIILTGDISGETLSAIAERDCVQLNKPVKPAELTQTIQDLLSALPHTRAASPQPGPDPHRNADGHVIFLVDDDHNIRSAVRTLLEEGGRTVEDFPTGEAFLAAYRSGSDGCLLVDAYLPGMGGLELLRLLRASGDALPAIMITGNSDVPMAVEAMKTGAADFIEKPISAADLLGSVAHALERSADSSKQIAWQDSAAEHIAELTPRQHQVMDLVLAGHPSKNIAADLGISQRTVENHRASIMKTTGAKSMPALARLALAAAIARENKAAHADRSSPALSAAAAAE